MDKECATCGAQFRVPYPSCRRKYCSSECRPKSKPPAPKTGRLVEWVKCECLWCGKEFEIPPWSKRRGRGKYCSHKCSCLHAPEKHRLGGYGNHPKADKKLIVQGYYWIYLPPDARPDGWKHHRYPEHRHVMRQVLGRDLLPGENVHHVNGDKLDNRPENLELWLTHQPKGGRVEDILQWAYEIIERYEDAQLRGTCDD